jgi:hypothetical protein
VFLRIFAIISCYSALLILLSVSFVKIVQVATVLGAIEIFNVLAIHLDDHVGVPMPHDPCNPEGIFTAAQGIGRETVPGLFHFPVVKTGFFQDGFPYLVDRIVAD